MNLSIGTPGIHPTPRHCMPAIGTWDMDGLMPACSLGGVLTDDGGDPQGEIAQPSADVILWQGRALPLRGGADGRAMTGFGVVSRWR